MISDSMTADERKTEIGKIDKQIDKLLAERLMLKYSPYDKDNDAFDLDSIQNLNFTADYFVEKCPELINDNKVKR